MFLADNYIFYIDLMVQMLVAESLFQYFWDAFYKMAVIMIRDDFNLNDEN